MKPLHIRVNMRQSSPGIIRNCAIIGNGFFELDKISFVDNCDEIHNGSERTIFFNLVCDGVLFKINYQYLDTFEEMDEVKEHDLAAFKKFNMTLIDSRFDDKTRQDLKDKKYI